jgi:hypothetical protein
LAVVVSVEADDLAGSPREVSVILAVSLAPASADAGAVTATLICALAPAASGPTLDAALVAQEYPETATSNVSVKLPVFVTRNECVTCAPGSTDLALDAGVITRP